MGFKGITVNTAAEDAAHIYAQDDAAIYQSIFGGDGVLNIGSLFATTVISNNKVRVKDGILCVGGHIGRTEYADYEDLTIENGTTGKYRNDIIYATFVTSGDVDSFKLAVRKGTEGSSATDPAVTQGNLYEGGTTREYPLWRVKLEGLSIVAVEQMFTVIPTIPDLQQKAENLQTQINTANSNLGNLNQVFSAVDLNTLKTRTSGYCSSCDNRPNGVSGGYIDVIPSGNSSSKMVLQKYTVYQNNITYYRQCLSDGTWTEWGSFALSSDLMPSVGSGYLYFADTAAGVISTMMPYINSTGKTITITKATVDGTTLSISGFQIGRKTTGFYLACADTTVATACKNKMVYIEFTAT